MPLKKNKKIKEIKLAGLLAEACFLFKAKNIDASEIDAELLMASVLKQDRVFIIAHPELIIKPNQVIKFQKLVKARLAGWSIAVLIGYKEFYGLTFKVNKDVLVPRPETEILVDTVLEKIKTKKSAFIMDIGTGSGAIITAIHNNLRNSHNEFYASDKSSKALVIAKANILKHQAKITLLKGDLLKPYWSIINKEKPQDIIITANLPYLKPSEMLEPSIKKEPKSALLSGSNGLWHYKRLFSQLKKLKATNVFLICEINPEQADEIEKLARASFLKATTYFKNDYTNRIRFFILEF